MDTLLVLDLLRPHPCCVGRRRFYVPPRQPVASSLLPRLTALPHALSRTQASPSISFERGRIFITSSSWTPPPCSTKKVRAIGIGYWL